MTTLDFLLTEEIYNRAIEANSGSCVVAEAIQQAYPKLSKPSVNAATIRVTDQEAGKRYIFLTPPSIVETLLFFDQGWKEDKLPKRLRARDLIRVVPITRSPSSLQAAAEQRARRLVELESKLMRGEKLSGEEKRSLTRIRNYKAPPPRPTTRGPVKSDEHGVLHGGVQHPEKKRHHKMHPNMLAGKHRHFGQKTAQPSRVFREAVAKEAHEVAQILAQQLAQEIVAKSLKKDSPSP